MANLYELLSACWDHSRTFAVLDDRSERSYRDLHERSAAYANTLVALGLGPGDRLLAQIDKSIEVVMLYLGCVRAGIIFVPLNPAYTLKELVYFLEDAEPSLFVCDRLKRSVLEVTAHACGVTRVEDLDRRGLGSLAALADAAPREFQNVASGDADPIAILYTSGTTGRSKGAVLSHGNLASNAISLCSCWRFSMNDRLVHILPLFHTHGLFVAINVTLAAGSSLILLPQYQGDKVAQALRTATVMMGVPTHYIRMLGDALFSDKGIASVRLFISGSAPLPPDVHQTFKAQTGHEILERYGMTETNMISTNPYEGPRVPGSVGLPLPDVSIQIRDPDTGAEMPTGEIGMIEVAGPSVFRGYWRRPERTRSDFRGRFFLTGDLGTVNDAGYLTIVGRKSDLIISGGFNIYPAEVEAALVELGAVQECAVIGVPHTDLGEAVVAVIVPMPGVACGPDRIFTHLADRLARFKQPRHLEFVHELPRNAMGKVQKTLLRERFAGSFAPESGTDMKAPVTTPAEDNSSCTAGRLIG